MEVTNFNEVRELEKRLRDGLRVAGKKEMTEKLAEIAVHAMIVRNYTNPNSPELFEGARLVATREVTSNDSDKRLAAEVLSEVTAVYESAETLIRFITAVFQQHASNLSAETLIELSESFKDLVLFLDMLRIIPVDDDPMIINLSFAAGELDRRMIEVEPNRHWAMVLSLKSARSNQV